MKHDDIDSPPTPVQTTHTFGTTPIDFLANFRRSGKEAVVAARAAAVATTQRMVDLKSDLREGTAKMVAEVDETLSKKAKQVDGTLSSIGHGARKMVGMGGSTDRSSCASVLASECSMLLKDSRTVEAIGELTYVLSSKTGTVTQADMTVWKVVYGYGGVDGDEQEQGMEVREAQCSISANGTCDMDSHAFRALVRAAALCNTASFDETSKYGRGGGDIEGSKVMVPFMVHSEVEDGVSVPIVQWEAKGNTTDCALLKFAQAHADAEQQADAPQDGKEDGAAAGGVDAIRRDHSKIAEVPFGPSSPPSACNRMHSSICRMKAAGAGEDAGGRLLLLKGAPEGVLERCTTVLGRSAGGGVEGAQLAMGETERTRLACQVQKLASQGLRVIALAQKVLPYAKGGDGSAISVDMEDMRGLCLVGLLGLVDCVRPAVGEVMGEALFADIKVGLVSRDHPCTTAAIARKVGLMEGMVGSPMSCVTLDVAKLSDTSGASAIVGQGEEGTTMTSAWEWNKLGACSSFVLGRCDAADQADASTATGSLVARMIQQLQNQGHKVGYLGECAAALTIADVGVVCKKSGGASTSGEVNLAAGGSMNVLYIHSFVLIIFIASYLSCIFIGSYLSCIFIASYVSCIFKASY
jgi:magnesium-transporting ATPase (P-type)